MENTLLITEIISTVAIVITLIFLAVQIRGETLARRAQTRQELANSRRNGLELHLANPDLRKVRGKTRRGEKLDDAERDILFWYFALMLRDFENLVYQHKLGTLDRTELDVARDLLRIQFEGEVEFKTAAKQLTDNYLPTYSQAMIDEMKKIGLLES